jgi:alkylation response protein AidB-like acyl-CoA dehydrogenase
MTILHESLTRWLDEHADSLDADGTHAGELLARLAASGLFRTDVPEAVAIVAALAGYSLAAAFVYWAQRAVIACVAASPNAVLAERLLPALREGTVAGAPGLSNAMKFLGGLDRLHIRFDGEPAGARLDGSVAWATNLRAGDDGFVVLVAAADAQERVALFAVPHDAAGVTRTPDLDLAGLRATNTAALRFDGVTPGPEWLLHAQAKTLLPAVRPAFVGMQCGLGFGLARASLDAAAQAQGGHPLLAGEIAALRARVDGGLAALADGLAGGSFGTRPLELLELRVDMVETACAAVQLELQALGGRAWLRGRDGGCMRRWREAAFLPLVTPTLLQLKTELARARA